MFFFRVAGLALIGTFAFYVDLSFMQVVEDVHSADPLGDQKSSWVLIVVFGVLGAISTIAALLLIRAICKDMLRWLGHSPRIMAIFWAVMPLKLVYLTKTIRSKVHFLQIRPIGNIDKPSV